VAALKQVLTQSRDQMPPPSITACHCRHSVCSWLRRSRRTRTKGGGEGGLGLGDDLARLQLQQQDKRFRDQALVLLGERGREARGL
jgi:hypothetical protein